MVLPRSVRVISAASTHAAFAPISKRNVCPIVRKSFRLSRFIWLPATGSATRHLLLGLDRWKDLHQRSLPLIRQAGGGQRRRAASCLNSPKHALVARTNCYANGQSRFAASDGVHCWPCSAARAVAMSLLELPGARGADGATPPSRERNFRCVGLA